MKSNDSPEIPDRGETSDIPGLPSGGRQTGSDKNKCDIVLQEYYSNANNNVQCKNKNKTDCELIRRGQVLKSFACCCVEVVCNLIVLEA